MIRRLTESQIVIAFIKPGRSRLFSGCFLGIGLALLSLWFSAHVWAQEPGGSPANLDVILLIDNSLSMSDADPVTGAPPSDPEGLRIQAAKFLVDYLKANAETLGADYRVGVVSFGGVVGDLVPLRLLQDDTVRDGIHTEEIQFTDFRGPLQFALREFRAKSFGTGNRMAVVLFTDGRPNLTDAPVTEQELRAYFEDLAPLVGELQDGGVSLFFLGIGDAQENGDNWARLIPRGHYTPVTSTTELADVYHDIVADLTGVAASEEQVLPAGQAASIRVEPYLEHVLFSFVKSDPAIRIVLTSTTGAVLTPTIGTPDIPHSIYSITNPDAGAWNASWEGEGEVWYWVDKQYPLIRVEPIESVSLVGQPITITASLVRNNEPIEDPDLHLEAEITLPAGGVVTQALLHIGGGRYTGGYEGVQAGGAYTVVAKAVLDGHLLSVRPMPVMVEVFPLSILPTPTPQPTQTLAPATVTPMPTATPTPTPTAGLVELLRRGRGPTLVLIVVGLGMAFWLLYRIRVSSEREKKPRAGGLVETIGEVKKATSLGQITERELSEEQIKAQVAVKPVTRWFPNNVGLDDVHVAWVLHNEGPGFAKIDQITLYWAGQELECDTKGEMLLRGAQKRVAFRLGALEGFELPTDLDLALAVSLSDKWERRTERVCYPHRGFEALKDLHGDVIGEEIVGLLQSNNPLPPDELRQYCLETKLYVHCNQLALLQLLEYSGGYPLLVHILLNGLVRYLKDGERWKTGQPRYVTCTDVPEVVEYIVGWDLMCLPGLIARAWDDFPLEAKRMLEKRDGRYRLRARLLEEWLRARQERDRALQSA
jgi:hypothetical protein